MSNKPEVLYCCALAEGYDGNPAAKDGTCAKCEAAIKFAPYAPEGVTKICPDCAIEIAREYNAKGRHIENMGVWKQPN